MTLSLIVVFEIVRRWSLQRQLSGGQTGTDDDRSWPKALTGGVTLR